MMFEREDSPYNAISGVHEGRPGVSLAYGGRKWPRCWHSWRYDSKGAWGYKECRKCHRRKAWKGQAHGVVSLDWMLTGEEKPMAPPAPTRLVPLTPPPKPLDPVATAVSEEAAEALAARSWRAFAAWMSGAGGNAAWTRISPGSRDYWRKLVAPLVEEPSQRNPLGFVAEVIRKQRDEELKERLTDDDGPVLLTLREEIGGNVEARGWCDDEGVPLHPNDRSVGALGDETSDRVKTALLAIFEDDSDA